MEKCYVCSAPNQIDVLLKIRDMWTFNKHKESVSDHYNFIVSTAPGTVLSTINVAICGNKLLVRLEYGGATPRGEQLLINWKTLHTVVSVEFTHQESFKAYTDRTILLLAACKARCPVPRPRPHLSRRKHERRTLSLRL